MAITVKETFGAGGSGLSVGDPNLAEVLRGLVDDIQTGVSATIAEADAELTTVASADATDLASAITLVNEIKASYNADMALVVALLNEIKAALNATSSGTYSVTKG